MYTISVIRADKYLVVKVFFFLYRPITLRHLIYEIYAKLCESIDHV